jgi:hypothetical protein
LVKRQANAIPDDERAAAQALIAGQEGS